jgi:hypothetical protein
MCFILINLCIIFQINFLKNLILIKFKGIEANYFYVYQTNFILKINHMNLFFTFHSDMKPHDTKSQVTTKKIKWYRGIIKSVTQHSYFDKKPNK